ncbi:MAG TPA: NAD(P)-dependent alcohol dehydrogenase [Candidatus Limnocylindrales bacterium]|nr:NAD(P)-dependent alcohol dehydrogenase [Candidatus Limnocylindrales bacterium]
MRAIVNERFGGPNWLRLRVLPLPEINEHQVLVRVHAASVNPYDWHMTRADPWFIRLTGNGFWRPKQLIPGADFAGVVERTGPMVTRFKPGDEVFGLGGGSFAEYIGVREDRLAPKPANITFEQAAAVPLAALTAWQGLKRGGIAGGKKVLIVGASGGIGTFAVQLARHFGADVTAVCSTRHVEVVRSLGARQVIDYTRADYVRSGQTFDLILDLVSSRSTRRRLRVLAPDGTLVVVGGPLRRSLLLLLTSRFSRRNMSFFLTENSREDLLRLGELLEKGEIAPVVERTYQLEEVPAALRYVEQGHSQGKHVIAVRH